MLCWLIISLLSISFAGPIQKISLQSSRNPSVSVFFYIDPSLNHFRRDIIQDNQISTLIYAENEVTHLNYPVATGNLPEIKCFTERKPGTAFSVQISNKTRFYTSDNSLEMAFTGNRVNMFAGGIIQDWDMNFDAYDLPGPSTQYAPINLHGARAIGFTLIDGYHLFFVTRYEEFASLQGGGFFRVPPGIKCGPLSK